MSKPKSNRTETAKNVIEWDIEKPAIVGGGVVTIPDAVTTPEPFTDYEILIPVKQNPTPYRENVSLELDKTTSEFIGLVVFVVFSGVAIVGICLLISVFWAVLVKFFCLVLVGLVVGVVAFVGLSNLTAPRQKKRTSRPKPARQNRVVNIENNINVGHGELVNIKNNINVK